MSSLLPYRDMAEYFRQQFPHYKVQKISLSAGTTCPNRDGLQGFGGCTYCNNRSFTPNYTRIKSITQQMEEGIAFFSHKYPEMKYLAYFQAYTNTYGDQQELIAKYEEALRVEGCVGIVVGTRPDCMPDTLLDYFESLARRTFVYIEYGIESTKEESLQRIHRGHTFACSAETIARTAARGIPVGAHLIIGLPGETEADHLLHIQRLSSLPITSLKLHQLQILHGTEMAREYAKAPDQFALFTPEGYMETLGRLISHLRPTIYIDRFTSSAPAELLIAPRWNIKNHVFTHRVVRYLEANGLTQGCAIPPV